MPELTKQFIELETQTPVSGQCFYRDEDVPGFGVRVTPKSKSYIFEKRVDGVNRRITIGKYNEMSFDSARKLTLREVLQKFFEIKHLQRTVNSHERAISLTGNFTSHSTDI